MRGTKSPRQLQLPWNRDRTSSLNSRGLFASRNRRAFHSWGIQRWWSSWWPGWVGQSAIDGLVTHLCWSFRRLGMVWHRSRTQIHRGSWRKLRRHRWERRRRRWGGERRSSRWKCCAGRFCLWRILRRESRPESWNNYGDKGWKLLTSAPKRLYGRILNARNPRKLFDRNCRSHRMSRRWKVWKFSLDIFTIWDLFVKQTSAQQQITSDAHVISSG